MIIDILLPHLSGGGIARTRMTLAEGFLRRGHRVRVLLLKAGERIDLVPQGAEVEVIGPLRTRALAAHLARRFRQDPPDVCLTSKELHTFAALLARTAGRRRIAVIPTMHGDFATRTSENRSGAERLWLPLAVRFAFSRADAVVAVSDAVREGLRRIGLRNVHAIENAFDLASIRQAADQSVNHDWLRPERDMPCIVAAGRLAPQKDYGTLIAAMQHINRDRDVRLLILGEGPQRDHLAAQIANAGLAERIDMPGYSPNPFPSIRASDLFVLASLWEGLPGVLVQALCLGRRIVATDAPGGTAGILRNGAYGRLVPPQDPQALANAILAALDDPSEPEKAMARAEDFAMERAVDKWLALFRRVGLHV